MAASHIPRLVSVVVACFAAWMVGNGPIVSPLCVWEELSNVTARAQRFSREFDLAVALPSGNESWRDYRRVEVALLEWHSQLYALQDAVSPGDADAGHAALLASALQRERQQRSQRYQDFSSDDDDEDEQEPASGSEHRERGRKHKPDGGRKHKHRGKGRQKGKGKKLEMPDTENQAANVSSIFPTHPSDKACLSEHTMNLVVRFVAAYGVLVALSFFYKDTQLSWIALALAVALLPVVFQARLLRSALNNAVENLRLRQVQLAGVFPSSSKAEMIAQHLIIQKIDVMCDYWEKQNVGMCFVLPVVGQRFSLDTDVLGTIIIGNLLKLAELAFARWIPLLLGKPSRRT